MSWVLLPARAMQICRITTVCFAAVFQYILEFQLKVKLIFFGERYSFKYQRHVIYEYEESREGISSLNMI